MTIPKKQLKITKLFKRGATTNVADDCDELQEEVRQLEQKVKEKQTELFQIQRNSYRRKPAPPKKKDDSFVRPQRIILNNSIESLKRTIELISMLTSTEVQSYVAEDYCCVVFHMQHSSEHIMSHGLRINMQSGKNEISAMSLPLGFNLSGVMEDFDNVMKPECLAAIRKALVAYYHRLEQFNKLKKLVNIEAELFKALDGSHIEVSMYLQRVEGEDQVQYPVTLTLDYRVYDIRPKNYNIKESGDDLAEVKELCAVFKKKPLHKAFKEAFLREDAQYQLVQQWGSRPHPMPRRRRRPRPALPHNDDTFRPEDCSDQGEDEDYNH